jgi:hypothetical protein
MSLIRFINTIGHRVNRTLISFLLNPYLNSEEHNARRDHNNIYIQSGK